MTPNRRTLLLGLVGVLALMAPAADVAAAPRRRRNFILPEVDDEVLVRRRQRGPADSNPNQADMAARTRPPRRRRSRHR